MLLDKTEWFRFDQFYPENIGYYEFRVRPRYAPYSENHDIPLYGTRYWDGQCWRISKNSSVSTLNHSEKHEWRGFQHQQFL